MFTQSDLTSLTQMIQDQQDIIPALRVELEGLRGSVRANADSPRNLSPIAGRSPLLGVSAWQNAHEACDA